MEKVFISIALIIILGFAIYSNSLNGKFVWDDGYLIEDNAYIKSWLYIPKIFTTDWGRGAGRRFNCYRPNLGKEEEALILFEKAIEIDPDFAGR